MLNASAASLARSLGAHGAEFAELGGDLLVVARVGDRGDPRRVARGRAEEGRPRDIDHLDRLVEPDELDADGRRERLDVDDHEIDQADALGLQLLDLGRDVAPGEDAGIDRVVEGLDLAADIGFALGQGGDRIDLDAFRGQRIARAIGGVDLDPEPEQVAGEFDDAVSVRD